MTPKEASALIRKIAKEAGLEVTIRVVETKEGRRAWHEGTVHQRPDGLWIGRMRYKGYRHQVSAKHEEVCRRRLRELRVRLEKAVTEVTLPTELDANGNAYVRISSPAFRRWIYARDGGRCGLCRKPVAFAEIHVDHIRPRLEGGTDAVENLRITHPRCNVQRSAWRQVLRSIPKPPRAPRVPTG